MQCRISRDGGAIVEPEREIRVVERPQVLVVGGGTAGTAAALAAARAGARTVIVERASCLGGVGTTSLMALYTLPYKHLYGICRELVDAMAEEGGAVRGPVIPFSPESFKRCALARVQAAGVKVLFYSWTTDTIVDGNTVKGVVVENKSGRQAILADMIIDASGDGDIAVKAGAEYVLGREQDGKMRPMSIVFKMGPVDIKKIAEYRERHPDDFSPDPGHNVLDMGQRIVRLDGFFSIIRSGRDRGVTDRNIHYLRLYGIAGETGDLYVNSVRVYGVDGTNAEDLSRAQQEGVRQIEELVRFIRCEIPGFERAELLETAANIGVRETRRILGDYVLTIDDLKAARRFPDTIATALIHMVPGVEIHSPDGGEGDANDPYVAGLVLPFNEFSIPLRCLLPRKLENIVVAGRCLSTTHEGDGWTRSMPIVMQVGEGAGVAAALAALNRTSPRRLDNTALHAELKKQGAHFELPA